jgi:hypothetical protein
MRLLWIVPFLFLTFLIGCDLMPDFIQIAP